MIRLIATCLSLCFMLSLSACGTGTNGSTADLKSPPVMLPIGSYEDFELFMEAGALSDAELNDYLSENPYSFYGIESRNDVSEFAEPFYSTGYPSVSDTSSLQDFSLQYFPNEPRYNFAYLIDGVLYSFQYTIYSDEIDRSGMTIVKTSDIDNRPVVFYQGTRGLVGEIYSGNYQILVTVQGYSDTDEITFENFTWQYPASSYPTS